MVPTNSTTRLTRSDALPEGTDYTLGENGLGCEVNPVPMGCLECPLLICKFEEGRAAFVQKDEARKRMIIAYGRYKTLHHSVEYIATDMGVSTRTVQRWFQLAEQHTIR